MKTVLLLLLIAAQASGEDIICKDADDKDPLCVESLEQVPGTQTIKKPKRPDNTPLTRLKEGPKPITAAGPQIRKLPKPINYDFDNHNVKGTVRYEETMIEVLRERTTLPECIVNSNESRKLMAKFHDQMMSDDMKIRKEGFKNSLRCINPCWTKFDLEFMAQCEEIEKDSDESPCTEEKKEAARRSRRFEDWQLNDQNICVRTGKARIYVVDPEPKKLPVNLSKIPYLKAACKEEHKWAMTYGATLDMVELYSRTIRGIFQKAQAQGEVNAINDEFLANTFLPGPARLERQKRIKYLQEIVAGRKFLGEQFEDMSYCDFLAQIKTY